MLSSNVWSNSGGRDPGGLTPKAQQPNTLQAVSCQQRPCLQHESQAASTGPWGPTATTQGQGPGCRSTLQNQEPGRRWETPAPAAPSLGSVSAGWLGTTGAKVTTTPPATVPDPLSGDFQQELVWRAGRTYQLTWMGRHCQPTAANEAEGPAGPRGALKSGGAPTGPL